MVLIPHVFSQCLTLYFILSQTQRAAERALARVARTAWPWLSLMRLLLPPAILSAPVECLPLFSLLYPCMNGCKVNQLLGKPEPLLIKPQNSPVLKHSAPALSTDLPTPLAAELLSIFFGGGGQCADGSRDRCINPFRFTPQVRFVALKFTGRMSPLTLW